MTQQNGVAKYYERFGSWFGYNLIMGRSQHAGYWDENTRNEKQAQKNCLEKLAKLLNLKSGEKVLDAGSGQGYAARYLAEKTGAKITGITITPREIRVSEKLSRKTKNAPKFLLGDYSATTFPGNYFDIIYTIETLAHAKNMEKTFREFYRILKPGGKIVFLDYEINTRKPTCEQKELYEFLRENAGAYGIYQMNPGEISRDLRTVGFKNIRETDWTKFTKPTFDRLRRIAKPFARIKPTSRIAKYFVNAIMASRGYSNLYEAKIFRFLIYEAKK